MFWRKRVIAMASEYPDVELSHMYVDNAAMQLVRNPKQVFSLSILRTFEFLRAPYIFSYFLFLNPQRVA